jgi:hypothetical protein
VVCEQCGITPRFVARFGNESGSTKATISSYGKAAKIETILSVYWWYKFNPFVQSPELYELESHSPVYALGALPLQHISPFEAAAAQSRLGRL